MKRQDFSSNDRERRRSSKLRRLAAGGLLAWSTLVHAAWPEKPIRLVVPYGPGGSSDVIARLLGNEMSKSLGQTVIIDNKGGASGIVAMQDVARSTPDGYTIVLGHVGTLAVNPSLFPKLPYSDSDFAPVALLVKVPMVFAVSTKLPAQTLGQFVALAKAQPGKLSYGSAGNGSAGHLAFEMLKAAAGINLLHIPYKGTGAQLTDLLAGNTDAAAAGPPGFVAQAKAGKIRILASGSPQRLAALPDVPTVAESGYPGFDSSQWFGILAPAKTSPEIVARLHAAAVKALTVDAIRTRLEEDGSTASPLGPVEFGKFIKGERERWSAVVRKANLRPD
ncbi:MAG TPA: tripartite tricarboxylate transporter substrate binding protein [Ideonella sp.]|uniref:Bug family tripartite tricarboxylate transporter substrate binding protein n=1 Tax=Ideonella sp. TaxID=1929293 RepID=UPI002CFC436E|nr:tripartite tricarboxylate transporter substrate binding protein [Ideonella sp.]HSI47195.1 tripartite tricarboxylate transporter substrate binding protein [Ideonella sp.]